MTSIWDLPKTGPAGLKLAQQVELHRIEALQRAYADRVMDESGHQQFLFKLLKKLEPFEPLFQWIHSVPNGAGKQSVALAGRLRGEGQKAGVFDINWDLARGQHHGLKIEMKKPRVQGVPGMTYTVPPGTPSLEQLLWLEHYRLMGYRAEICYGWRAAFDVIMDHLGGS